MASPFWQYPAVDEGRIDPRQSIPCGVGGYYYYPYYYHYPSSYYYQTTDEYVFCLGQDVEDPQPTRMSINDYVRVEQILNITAAHKLIRFCWHMRTPEGMPTARTILNNGDVSFVKASGLISRAAVIPGQPNPFLIGTVDTEAGIVLHGTPASSPLSTDLETHLVISGAANPLNNGTKRIISVPWDHGVVVGGDRYGIGDALAEDLNDSGVTITTQGLQWVARVYTDHGLGYTEYLPLSEREGHTAYRSQLAINVSKYTGNLGVRFELKLEVI